MSSLASPPSEAWSHARRSRDARFDGLFFIAVRSTGIYCRPVCPAPSPKEGNIVYYRQAAAAAADGFRPCLRCRPELAPGLAPCDSGERGFDLAWQRVREGALDQVSVAGLAAELGVSERQLRRQFLQRIGVTPKAVHNHQRLLLAKQLLSETRLAVTEVAFAAGFRSLRRFNQAFLEQCGMPPTRIRARPARAAAVGEISLKLAYRPPYDFAGLLAFLGGRAIDGIERIHAGGYERVLGPAERPVLLRIEPIPGEHALRLRLDGQPSDLPDLLRRLRRLFDLDADPAAIADRLAVDPRLAAAIAAQPGRRMPGAFDGFETAVRAVLGQQVSVAAARTLCIRLVERFGTPVRLTDGREGRLFPSAKVLAEAAVGGIGLPGARANTLRGLARAVASGRIDLERAQPLEQWVESLCALPGIGPWTAQYMAMRCLHHPDAFPAGDLVLRKRLGEGAPLPEREAERRSQSWRPWRAYAVAHLWASTTQD